MSSKRIEWLDIAKGIGIFLVVYAHARAPYNSYIYNFHMPLFFLISGILYKSGRDLKSYIFRKIQTLYIPFVSWNLIFIIGKSILRHQEISVDYIIEVLQIGTVRTGEYNSITKTMLLSCQAVPIAAPIYLYSQAASPPCLAFISKLSAF